MLMTYLFTQAEPVPFNPIFVFGFIGVILLICGYYILRFLETIYAKYYHKPYFVHLYIFQKKITPRQKRLLNQFPFYQKLEKKEQKYFEHRIYRFIENTNIHGREGFVVDEEVKVTVAMIAVMLTFGMRNYLLEYLQTILIYPTAYFSVMNQTEHKGEYNPRLKTLVFSWEDFMHGNQIEDDAINLGIHEITHAIHYNAIKNNDISSELFYDTFLELEAYLSDESLREKLNTSNVLREYAFTDKFEFVAVLIEVFIESPKKLRADFPKVYALVKQMLNYRFAGY